MTRRRARICAIPCDAPVTQPNFFEVKIVSLTSSSNMIVRPSRGKKGSETALQGARVAYGPAGKKDIKDDSPCIVANHLNPRGILQRLLEARGGVVGHIREVTARAG